MACCVFVFSILPMFFFGRVSVCRRKVWVVSLFDMLVSVKVRSDSIRFYSIGTTPNFVSVVKRDEFNFRTTAVSFRFVGG
jgi:hypothetical protein